MGKRYIDDSMPDILAGLRWLGLQWDEGPEVGGNYGPLAERTFRIGHMGYQADVDLVARGMDVLAGVIG